MILSFQDWKLYWFPVFIFFLIKNSAFLLLFPKIFFTSVLRLILNRFWRLDRCLFRLLRLKLLLLTHCEYNSNAGFWYKISTFSRSSSTKWIHFVFQMYSIALDVLNTTSNTLRMRLNSFRIQIITFCGGKMFLLSIRNVH